MDRTYSPMTLENDIHELLTSNTLDSAEVVQLRLYISMGIVPDSALQRSSYRQLWTASESFEEARKAQEQQILLKNTEVDLSIKKREASMSMEIKSKTYKELNNQTFLICQFSAHNLTDKDIRAFKGEIVFQDLFDEEIQSLSLSQNQMIKAGEKASFEVKASYNSFLNRDLKLRQTELHDLKLLWLPEKIIFMDNSSL